MLGKSVYISSSREDQNKTIAGLNKGDYCFISLHMPEDLVDGFEEKALGMINRINATGAKIIADISPDGIKALGYDSFMSLAKANLVWGLRPDYGLTTKEIIDASRHTNIVINASVIDDDLVFAFADNDVPIFAMHNFYPRVETGLDEDYCFDCSDFLKSFGGRVAAFISGDAQCRGPIFSGLPTVESYRNLNPYIQYLYLKYFCSVDAVFVGDIAIKPETEKLIYETENDGVVRIPAEVPEYLYNKVFTIRPDSNSLASRLQESRAMFSDIEPNNTDVRHIGDITIDNNEYGRYAGEVQIVLQDLPLDKRVNVIGSVLSDFMPILRVCTRSQKVMFVVQ